MRTDLSLLQEKLVAANKTIEVLNQSGIQKVLLSRHDSCEHSSDKMHKELDAEVCLLRAGAEYVL